MNKLSFILLVVIVFASCTKDNEDEFYSELECDTLNVSFADDVFPILETSCVSCHSEGNFYGIELDTYESISVQVENGRLLGSITHQPGFSPMPKNGELDSCSIALIANWIDQGAAKN